MTKTKPADVIFVNYNLTDTERKKLKSQAFSSDDAFSALVKLIEENYKVTFSEDKFHKCFACFVIPTNPGGDNSGYILSARGSTPDKAFKQACYLHWQKFDRIWSSWRGEGTEELDD